MSRHFPEALEDVNSRRKAIEPSRTRKAKPNSTTANNKKSPSTIGVGEKVYLVEVTGEPESKQSGLALEKRLAYVKNLVDKNLWIRTLRLISIWSLTIAQNMAGLSDHQ